MNQKLEVLTQKLYNEGIHRAEIEGKKLIDQARQEAEQIKKQAEKQAAEMVAEAREEIRNHKQRTLSELHMMSTQVVEALRQQISALITERAIDTPVRDALRDENTVSALIQSIARQIKVSSDDTLVIHLPELEAAQWKDKLRQTLTHVLENAPAIHPASGLKSGFQIGRQGENFRISCTDEDFKYYLRSFLSQEFQSLIGSEN